MPHGINFFADLAVGADWLVYSNKKLVEAAPRFELGVKVLQTSALPLGYAARRKNLGREKKERETGLEPATTTLARWGSTTELLSLQIFKYN
jgi:hypothetical protein